MGWYRLRVGLESVRYPPRPPGPLRDPEVEARDEGFGFGLRGHSETQLLGLASPFRADPPLSLPVWDDFSADLLTKAESDAEAETYTFI